MAGSITSANAIVTLSVTGIFSTPIQIQGFSADNVYDAPETEITQVLMGVDGLLSGGFVYNPVTQTFTLQADSESNRFFETWAANMFTARDIYIATGTTNLVSTGRSYRMERGFLTAAHQFPTAGRVLQPRRYTIQWQRVVSVPN